MAQPNEWWVTAIKSAILHEIERECETIEGTLSTAALVERLFPAMTRRGAGNERATSLFAILAAEANRSLKPYCTKGAPKTTRFGVSHPWLWHKRKAVCPVCEGTGFA